MSKKKSKDYNKASSVEDDIKELIEQGFLEKVKSNGSSYLCITKKGYEKLTESSITFIPDFDTDEPTKH
jgi:predicted transcriptional regulator